MIIFKLFSSFFHHLRKTGQKKRFQGKIGSDFLVDHVLTCSNLFLISSPKMQETG